MRIFKFFNFILDLLPCQVLTFLQYKGKFFALWESREKQRIIFLLGEQTNILKALGNGTPSTHEVYKKRQKASKGKEKQQTKAWNQNNTRNHREND